MGREETRQNLGGRLGHYEIGPRVGVGGMGEVYRGRDTKLGRDVAIKILLPTVATDPERLARFSREAQLLAQLNHPHIAHIHGLEDGPDGPFLVMEFVDGPTLADRIREGALPLDEALAIARQVAEALETAHERGIIHRDLKPANIKVQHDGTVKILDFGLAKALDPASGSREPGSDANSPTITTPAMTQAGLILGTAAYMSPEQAKGRPVDKRSDVWAFGCVLYEMLTARRAFEGEDVTDTIAAIVRGEPHWSALPPDTPNHIRLLLKRCLEKDRRTRLSDIAVARFLMNETVDVPAAAPATAASAAASARRAAMAWMAAGLVVGAAVVAGTWAWSSSPAEPARPARFTFTPPPEQPFVLLGTDHDTAVAPNGSFVVYRSSPPGLVLRRMDEIESRPLPATSGARFPFISADSNWVGFQVGNELRKAAVSGGAAITICRVPGAPRGFSWGDDEFIVLATSESGGLLRVSADGGEPKALTTADATLDERHVMPHVLPGSRWVLFTVLTGPDVGNVQTARIDAVNVVTGERKTLLRGGHDAAYAGSGYLVYGSTDMSSAESRFRGSLRAVRFDPERVESDGESVTLIEPIVVGATGSANYGVSRRGDLVYVPGDVATTPTAPRSLVWVNRRGVETPITAPRRAYALARISPDGARIALDVRDQTNDVWIWDIERQTLTSLHRDPAPDMSPLWTPDGKRVLWTSTRGGGNPNLFWQAADGSGTPERLTNNPTNQFPTSITADGSRVVLFGVSAPQNATDIFTVALGSPQAKQELLVSTHGLDVGGELSPDGRWLAYQSNESGETHIYVRPFPDVQAGRTQISTKGGTRAAWARNGRELFYLDQDGMLTSVPVTATGSSFSAGMPTRILNTAYYAGSSVLRLDLRAYDVAPDGQRFLMIKDSDAGQQKTAPAYMVVVLNWAEELKARLPAR